MALLLLAIFLSLLLIIVPVAVNSWQTHHSHTRISERTKPVTTYPIVYLAYFACLGFAFLLVEIPLVQRFILYLDHPTYAMAGILFSLLLFSAFGSYFSQRISLRISLPVLVIWLVILPLLLPTIFSSTLDMVLSTRLMITTIIVFPAGFLMGIPFPGGIHWMLGRHASSNLIPWVWAVNGSASVVAAVMASLFALSTGFTWVLGTGAACYLFAWLIIMAAGQGKVVQYPAR
jgi:hypothetical protein